MIKLRNLVYNFFMPSDEQQKEQEHGLVLNKYSLRFNNSELEKSYSLKEKQRAIGLFRIQSILHIVINLTYWINNQFFLMNLSVGYCRLAFSLWHAIIVLTQTYTTKIGYKLFIPMSQLISSIVSILLAYWYSEAQLFNKPCIDETLGQGINVGMNTGLITMSYILVCPEWTVQCLILLISQLLYIGMIGNLGSQYWTIYVLLFTTCLYFRFQEFYKRLDYYWIVKQNQNLAACKNIFDKTVPTSILIVTEPHINDITETNDDNLQVIYCNDFTMKYLNVHNHWDVINKLKNIFISSQEFQQTVFDILSQRLNKNEINHKQYYRTLTYNDYDISDHSEQFICFKFESENILNVQSFQQKQHFEIRIVSCLWENKKSIMVIMNDISEKVRSQHLKEVNTYKDRLLATVSHDLKTPLNGMVLAIDIMQSIVRGKQMIQLQQITEISTFLDDFGQSGQLLLSMINDLLDYSQINKGALRLQPKYFNITTTFKFVNSLLERSASNKGVRLIWDFHKITNQQIFQDENRLKQVLINLVANAIKFTPQGTITVVASQCDDNLIRIAVQDTGCGIPEDVQSNLFRLYSTYDLGDNNNHGIGLGLTISQQLVALLGPYDRIELESKYGKGSTFTFYIYRLIKSISQENSFQEFQHKARQSVPEFPDCMFTQTDYRTLHQKQQTSLINLPVDKHEPLVLIVDDTPFNIVALSAILSKISKFTIVKAFDGVQALEILENRAPDVIFMDVNMPEMDGYQCTQEIRKLEKKSRRQKHSVIFIVTAYTSAEDKDRSLQSGADGHIDKPVNMLELKQKLKDHRII